MQSAPIDLLFLRRRFERRAPTADFIFREIAARMRERLQLVRLDPQRILDAGCGSGADLPALQKNYPKAHVIGLDATHASLQSALLEQTAAQQSLQKMLAQWLRAVGGKSNTQLIEGDFGAVPLAEQSFELVWSNLALHWHPEPDAVFAEWRRLLRVNGLLMFSCFGPDSLKEIRQAFSGVDDTPHSLPFVDMHDFGDMLVNAGFATPVMDMEIITLTYDTVPQLFADVRALGGNPLLTRRKALMGKVAWQRVCSRLEAMRNPDGRIPLTLEIIYGHAFRPVPRSTKPGESIIKFDRLKK